MKDRQKLTKPTLLIFALMAFVLAMSSFIFNGILDQVAQQLAIPVSQTGLLNSSYAYGAGLGVPIALIIFRRFEQTSILKSMLLITILASFWMISSSSFEQLLLARFVTGITGNSYGVLAVATVSSLTAREKLGSTLSKLIMGASLALVVGIPLTRLLADIFDWRTDFLILIGLMILALIYFQLYLPKVTAQQKALKFKQELAFFKHKETLFVISSSLLIFIGYGAFYTYLTPYILELFPKVDSFMSFYLILTGLACFLGNLFGGYVSDRIGYQKALVLGCLGQFVLSLLIFLFQAHQLLSLILVILWAFAAWFIGLQINTGINIATDNKSNFLLSVNSSNIQLGQALGVSLSAALMAASSIHVIILISLLSALAVILVYLLFKKVSRD